MERVFFLVPQARAGFGEGDTCLVLLRVEVVISDDCDVEAGTQSLFEVCGAFRFQGERQGLLQGEMYKFVLRSIGADVVIRGDEKEGKPFKVDR